MTVRARLRSSVSAWQNRLSSGTKMLLVMSLALMPLGLIALFASIQSANNRQAQHLNETRIAAGAEARRVELALVRVGEMVRPAAARASVDPANCRRYLGRARALLGGELAISLYDRGGRPLCSSAARQPPAAIARDTQRPRPITLIAAPPLVRIASPAADGAYAVADVPAAMIGGALRSDDTHQWLALEQGGVTLPLTAPEQTRPLERLNTVRATIAGGAVTVVATSVANRISAIEVLLVVMPLLMWIGAALIGWVVVNELLLRPLGQLQHAVAEAAQRGSLQLPRITTPAREIQSLGEALAQATADVARRETALGEAFEHQVKLTREVHHRVKNNLQVVASLINLHARGTSGEVAGAYASIQRRVDALAIVHRNHFAELEDNRGVALRALIAELSGNLRATAPVGAGNVAITLDILPAHISQDVAVPVAFLVTEVVELVMTCTPGTPVDVALVAAAGANRAILSIHAPGLGTPECAAHPGRERFDRVVTGLARQLRAPLEIEPDAGRYSISIATLDPSLALPD